MTRMPSGVIRHRQRIDAMNDEEKKNHFKGKTKAELETLSWRLGYGKGKNVFNKYHDGESGVTKPTNEDTIDEGLRLTRTYENGNRKAKVYRDAEWEKHRVQFHKGGVHQKKADYHTSDKEDAHNTAKYWVSQATEEVETANEANDFNTAEKKYSKHSHAQLGSMIDRNKELGPFSKTDLGKLKKINHSIKRHGQAMNAAISVMKKTRPIEEEVEQVNEVGDTEKGQNALRNYVRKAMHSYVDHDRASDSYADISRKFTPNTPPHKKAINKFVHHVDKSVNRVIGVQRAGKRIKEEIQEIEMEDEIIEGKTLRIDPDNIRGSKKYKDRFRKSVKGARKADKSVAEEVVDEGKTFRANSDYRSQRSKNDLRKWSKTYSRNRDAKRANVDKKEA